MRHLSLYSTHRAAKHWSFALIPFTAWALLTEPSTASAAAPHGHMEEAAIGDFNNDGVIDKVVVEPNDMNGRGRLLIYLGYDNADGVLDHESMWYYDNETSNYWDRYPPIELNADSEIFDSQRAAGAAFGTDVTVGDFDDDGWDDIAFGAPGETVQGKSYAGTVYVLYGKHLIESPGFDPEYIAASKFQQGVGGILGWLESGDRFGTALTSGDLNCDGLDDLVVGVPSEDVMVGNSTYNDAGAINVLYGTDPGGLTSVDNEYINQEMLGGTTASGDTFGAAVAVGNFNSTGGGVLTHCAHLAIGAPNKDIGGNLNAGVVYVQPGQANGGGGVGLQGTLWHQDVANVLGNPQAQDRFGAALGTVDHGYYDDLWVRVPGEVCGANMETKYQVFDAGPSGVSINDSLFCSRHEPGIITSEAGQLVAKQDSYGPYMQYIPHSATEDSDMLMVIHGQPPALQIGEDPTALAVRGMRFTLMQRELIKVAEATGVILIAPGFKTTSFKAGGYADGHPANENPSGQSYRELMGRDIQADAWVNLIADSYEAVDLRPTDQLYIYGQSAGAQMVSRYIVRNPNRVIKAAMNSARSYGRPVSAEPDDPGTQLRWGYGTSALPAAVTSFHRDDFSGTQGVSYEYTPNLLNYEAAYSKSIFVNCGALEDGLDEDGNDDPHLDRFNQYYEETTAFMNSRGETSSIEFCVVPNMKHNFIAMLPYALEQMFPDEYSGPTDCVGAM